MSLEEIMQVRFFSQGCKVNQYDTGTMAEVFKEKGFVITQQEDADVLVVNSCAVTAVAQQKTRKLVRRLRRSHPDAIIALTGCLSQAFEDTALEMEEVDVIAGVNELGSLADMVQSTATLRKRQVLVTDFSKGQKFECLPFVRSGITEKSQKAYIKIEDGCDRYCSYCILPTARGPVRSRSPQDIKEQASLLAQAGFREIMLVGINISRYGADLGLSLIDAVQAADRGLQEHECRIRLGSLEPDLLGDRDYEQLANIRRLCAHFHLVLQSGSDTVLKRMNRRYSRLDYMQKAKLIKSLFENPSITTDIIVGFPGETDEEFQETCEFVKSIGLLRAHVFPFSSRGGTPAEAMRDQINPAVKKQRSKELTALIKELTHAFCLSQLDRDARVLIEQDGWGYTDNYLQVKTDANETFLGRFAKVKIIKACGEFCQGQVQA